jgi:hypothetical protein
MPANCYKLVVVDVGNGHNALHCVVGLWALKHDLSTIGLIMFGLRQAPYTLPPDLAHPTNGSHDPCVVLASIGILGSKRSLAAL